jgi:hypothetical protein
MTANGVLRPLKHGFKNLLAIKTLKGVIPLHLYQLIETRTAANWENVFMHGIFGHSPLQNLNYTPSSIHCQSLESTIGLLFL